MLRPSVECPDPSRYLRQANLAIAVYRPALGNVGDVIWGTVRLPPLSHAEGQIVVSPWWVVDDLEPPGQPGKVSDATTGPRDKGNHPLLQGLIDPANEIPVPRVIPIPPLDRLPFLVGTGRIDETVAKRGRIIDHSIPR